MTAKLIGYTQNIPHCKFEMYAPQKKQPRIPVCTEKFPQECRVPTYPHKTQCAYWPKPFIQDIPYVARNNDDTMLPFACMKPTFAGALLRSEFDTDPNRAALRSYATPYRCSAEPVIPIANNIMWQPPLGEVPGLGFPQRNFPDVSDISQLFKCDATNCIVYTHDKFLSNDYYNPFASKVSF